MGAYIEPYYSDYSPEYYLPPQKAFGLNGKGDLLGKTLFGYGKKNKHPEPAAPIPAVLPNSGPVQSSYVVPPQASYKPPQSGYGAPPQSSYGAPPQSSHESAPQSSYEAPPQSSYEAPPQSSYGAPPQSNYGAPSVQFAQFSGEGRSSELETIYGPPKLTDIIDSEVGYSGYHDKGSPSYSAAVKQGLSGNPSYSTSVNQGSPESIGYSTAVNQGPSETSGYSTAVNQGVPVNASTASSKTAASQPIEGPSVHKLEPVDSYLDYKQAPSSREIRSPTRRVFVEPGGPSNICQDRVFKISHHPVKAFLN